MGWRERRWLAKGSDVIVLDRRLRDDLIDTSSVGSPSIQPMHREAIHAGGTTTQIAEIRNLTKTILSFLPFLLSRLTRDPYIFDFFTHTSRSSPRTVPTVEDELVEEAVAPHGEVLPSLPPPLVNVTLVPLQLRGTQSLQLNQPQRPQLLKLSKPSLATCRST